MSDTGKFIYSMTMLLDCYIHIYMYVNVILAIHVVYVFQIKPFLIPEYKNSIFNKAMTVSIKLDLISKFEVLVNVYTIGNLH